MTYRLIDLFCGAGGMTLGFVDTRYGAGDFKSVWAIDSDPACVGTYNLNFGNATHAADCYDIEKWLVEGRPVPKADVVIGGPPCQGFSLLNKNRNNGDLRRALWEPFMDVVERSEAAVFVIENVPGLIKSPEFLEICERADRMGFEISETVLLAADYGSPQTRRRAVIIGRLGGSPSNEFPPLPSHAAPNSTGNLPDWITVRDAIGDLEAPIGTEFRAEPPPYDLHFGRNPTDVSKQRYRAVPPGGNRFDLQKNRLDLTPDCWIRKTSGGTDLFGRLWWHRPSVTIRTEFFKPEKGRYLHPEQHRPITHREAARLMGFPDDFLFGGTKIEIARQIGNAVPPDLAGAISGSVICALENSFAKQELKLAAG